MRSESATLEPTPGGSSPKVIAPRASGLTRSPDRPRVTSWSSGMAPSKLRPGRAGRPIRARSCTILLAAPRSSYRGGVLDELRDLIDRHARPDGRTAIDGLLVSRVESTEPHH